jgi:2'-5' RNA ligase
VYEISQFGRIQFLGSLLPAHVSLKQPFTFERMDVLENWFDNYRKGITPFRIELDHIYYDQWENHAIVGFGVREMPTLRTLHNQINQELKELVRDSSAPHDGDEYRFHLTIELGEVGSTNPYKRLYDSLPEKQVAMSFMANYIALFLYPYEPIEPGSFICYKVLPLAG